MNIFMVFGPALTRLRQKLFLSAFANQTHSVDFVRLHFTTSLWIADGEETSEVQPRRFSVVKLLTKSIECPFDIISYKMPSTHIHTHVQLKYVIKTLTEKKYEVAAKCRCTSYKTDLFEKSFQVIKW